VLHDCHRSCLGQPPRTTAVQIPPQEHSRRLLQEQDAEYEASLAADRERAAQRAEQQRHAREEAEARAAEEARERCVVLFCV
jgi:hypothetical protein